MEEESWRRNHGGAIMEEESWRRNPGGASLRRHLGGIWLGGIMEASGKHLGGIWEASTVGFPPKPKHHKSHNT